MKTRPTRFLANESRAARAAHESAGATVIPYPHFHPDAARSASESRPVDQFGNIWFKSFSGKTFATAEQQRALYAKGADTGTAREVYQSGLLLSPKGQAYMRDHPQVIASLAEALERRTTDESWEVRLPEEAKSGGKPMGSNAWELRTGQWIDNAVPRFDNIDDHVSVIELFSERLAKYPDQLVMIWTRNSYSDTERTADQPSSLNAPPKLRRELLGEPFTDRMLREQALKAALVNGELKLPNNIVLPDHLLATPQMMVINAERPVQPYPDHIQAIKKDLGDALADPWGEERNAGESATMRLLVEVQKWINIKRLTDPLWEDVYVNAFSDRRDNIQLNEFALVEIEPGDRYLWVQPFELDRTRQPFWYRQLFMQGTAEA